jgi:hypothetical protein
VNPIFFLFTTSWGRISEKVSVRNFLGEVGNYKSFERCPYYISGSLLFIKKNTTNYDLLKKYKIKDDFVVDIVHPNILKWRKDENFGVISNIKRTFVSIVKFLKRITRKY